MGERQNNQLVDQGLHPELEAFDAYADAQYGDAFSVLDAEKARQDKINQLLTEVEHLRRLRTANGEHLPATLAGVHQNLLTAVKEAAMPYAVSTVYHELVNGTYWWLDQDPVDVARSGKDFHRSEAALERVDVEIDEATDVRDNLRPGMIKVFISPKMSRQDATYEVAQQEHLADDDMLRIHMLDVDETSGAVRGKFMQSLLVSDIPLSAWVSMLKDPHNIFGQSFRLDDETSALSVMKLHRQLELPEAALPEGVVSLVEAVLPYMAAADRCKLEPRLQLYRSGQEELHRQAESIADRWLDFEVGLEASLQSGQATTEIAAFIHQLQHQWSPPMLALLSAHRLPDGGIAMSPALAAKLEKARRNTLWTTAAVVTGNEKVLEQLDTVTIGEIRWNEQMIQNYMDAGRFQEVAELQATMNRLIAVHNVEVGGGCAGRNVGGFGRYAGSKADDPLGSLAELDFDPFRDNKDDAGSEEGESSESKGPWLWSSGVCRIEVCPTRPATTKVGPCDVCRHCQYLFDRGEDPAYRYLVPASPRQKRTSLYLMDIIGKASDSKAAKASKLTSAKTLVPASRP